MKSGFKPYVWHDHRDYDAVKSFGATIPAQFPTTFDVDAKIWVPNQNVPQSFAGIPNIPALPEGCTDYTQTDLCMNEDGVQLDPMALENITHANTNGGSNIKASLEAARKAFNRTAYFNIRRTNGLDWYDTIRLVMLSTPEEKRAVSLGVPWYSSFGNPTNGVLPQFTQGGSFTWHNVSVSGWDARGLKIKSWQGPQYGEGGFVYMPRALVNQIMEIPGTCAFTLSKIAPAQIFQIDTTYVQWFVSLILNAWASFIKPSETAPIAPKLPQEAPLPPSPTPTQTPAQQPQNTPKYDWSTPQAARHSVRVICDEEGLAFADKTDLCATVGAESGWNPQAVNHKTKDYGIAQINEYYHIGTGKDFPSIEYVTNNPEACIRWMCKQWKLGHQDWWIAHKNGSYKNFL